MPNEVNKIFQGLFGGLQQVGNALIEKDTADSLQEVFNAGKNELMNSFQPVRNTGIGDNGMLNPPVEQDPNAGINSLYNTISKLVPYGKQGEPYVDMIEGIFKMNKPVIPEYDIREVNGQLIRYDKKNPSKFEVVYGDKKPEKTVYNQKFYEGLTSETVKDLTPNQIKDGFFFMPKDIQDALYNSNAELKDYVDNTNNTGAYEKTERTGGNRRGGRRKLRGDNKDVTTDLNNTDTQDDTKESAQIFADVQNATTKVEQKYNEYQKSGDQKKQQGLQKERVRIANELKQFDNEFASGKFSRDEMLDSLEDYLNDLEDAGVDEILIDEAESYIKKRASEMGILYK